VPGKSHYRTTADHWVLGTPTKVVSGWSATRKLTHYPKLDTIDLGM